MTLPLVTADERTRLLAHGAALAAGQHLDPLPVVRAVHPDTHVTWLLVSLDPADDDTAYGLIDLGIGMPSLGTVKLSDLAGIVGPRKLPVRRDRYFQAAPAVGVRPAGAGERRDHGLMKASAARSTEAHCDYFGLTKTCTVSLALMHQSGASLMQTVMIFGAACGT